MPLMTIFSSTSMEKGPHLFLLQIETQAISLCQQKRSRSISNHLSGKLYVNRYLNETIMLVKCAEIPAGWSATISTILTLGRNDYTNLPPFVVSVIQSCINSSDMIVKPYSVLDKNGRNFISIFSILLWAICLNTYSIFKEQPCKFITNFVIIYSCG